jgi:hypothetical protein
MKRRIVEILMAFCLLVPALAFAESTLTDKYSDAELIQIINDDGYSAVTKLKDGVIKVKIDGSAYLIFNHSDGALHALYGVGDAKISYEDINEWNRTKRFSRAYLDSDKNPILESDLLANGGLTKKHVTEFIKVFVGSVKFFKEFLVAHNNS